MMTRILVTGASGDIGVAVGGILRELDWVTAHGADAGDAWPGQLVYREVHRLPNASHPGYIEALAALVNVVGADLVLPLTEPELAVLAEQQGGGLPLLWPGPMIVSTFLDKWLTAGWLRNEGLPGPTTLPLAQVSSDDLPLIVKPRVGWGGRGIRLVTEAWELSGLQEGQDTDALVAQELLLPDDAEITCAVVRLGGVVRTLQLRRILSGGLTSMATVVAYEDVRDVLERIAELTELEGCINVQLRMTARGPQVFEINPRLSSTVRMRDRAGFHDLRWWLRGRHDRAPHRGHVPVGTRIFRLADEAVVWAAGPSR